MQEKSRIATEQRAKWRRIIWERWWSYWWRWRWDVGDVNISFTEYDDHGADNDDDGRSAKDVGDLNISFNEDDEGRVDNEDNGGATDIGDVDVSKNENDRGNTANDRSEDDKNSDSALEPDKS